jgi:hypothetical protein
MASKNFPHEPNRVCIWPRPLRLIHHLWLNESVIVSKMQMPNDDGRDACSDRRWMPTSKL